MEKFTIEQMQAVTGLKASTLRHRAKQLSIKPDRNGFYFWSDMYLIRLLRPKTGGHASKTHIYESSLNLTDYENELKNYSVFDFTDC